MTLRLLTLLGWWILFGGMVSVIVLHGSGMSRGVRAACLTLAGMHAIIALNASVIELAWVMKTVRPDSPLVTLASDLYNALYLFNAALAAVVPFLILASLLTGRHARAVSVLVAAGVAVFAMAVQVSGRVEDWSTLMQVSHALSFVTLVGLLLFWAGVLFNRVSRTNIHLLGVMAVISVFQLLLPIQEEFFTLVGRGEVSQLWNVHQWMQFGHVFAEVVIVAAWVRQGMRRPLVRPSVPV